MVGTFVANSNWACSSVDDLIRKYEKTGSYERTVGSSRPVTVTTPDNEETILDLTESQESQPGSSRSLSQYRSNFILGKVRQAGFLKRPSGNQ